MNNTVHESPSLPAPRIPLLFTYRDLVAGKGYLATVTMRGRVLATERDGEGVWMEGVEPGALAGGGKTLVEAHSDFRKGFTNVLAEIAEDVETFAAFRSEVERLFAEVNEAAAHDWQTTVENQGPVGKLAEAINVQIVAATTQPFVEVALKEEKELTPSDNRTECEPALAAA